MSSGIFHCLGPVADIERSVPPSGWRAAIDAIPDACAHPDVCVQGSCRRVAYDYLAAREAVIRAKRAMDRLRPGVAP